MLELLNQLSPFTALKELIAAGGWIVYWLFLACLIMWTVIAERWWFYNRILPVQAQQMHNQWKQRTDRHSWYSRHIRNAMISKLNAGMNENLPILRVLIPLCPLLGLIGTVTGMLEVFDAMALRGNADARAMASGVSQAMVATMSGLFVSITGLFPLYKFQQRVVDETELLSDHFEY